MLFLRSLTYWIGMLLSTLVVAPLGLLLFPFPLTARFHFIKSWALFNLWLLKITCGLRYEVDGVENIPDQTVIVFCKHQSTWETLVLQKLFPRQVWVLKRELLKIPFFGWGLAMLEPIAIDRSAGRKALKQLVDQGSRYLNEGRSVVIFPEGTRTQFGSSGKYHAGGAILAQKSGFPVLPIAHNAGAYWPKHSFIKYPGTIRLSIGPAIDSSGKKTDAILTESEQWIEGRMAELGGRTV
ncbi:1-acyl-sn-glycerol-3-phosphate acyltransferase [Solemya pervernicosa gill symbiont]|uniref:1-acyl-sn-glycerol-3-phosphate acyltransferase n=2 Tax=Gammaproteobacteria incertae sedis TaxID=118884 RepID=A0A1T2L4V1_9GAMM|nr:lysophospholipid acyltransferase family protein [Candidatus Reidiella endopervernicosa]OOZ40092.1 1-acyl-sn-glycerol-3-phosphate acyltransferase [Solemya pervernicosa gill symbiont]QKQ25408.1 1-acyl-sn-glycerol-3-phosphate acyltransferase [Candidatus Reidiella endopervernicosa]